MPPSTSKPVSEIDSSENMLPSEQKIQLANDHGNKPTIELKHKRKVENFHHDGRVMGVTKKLTMELRRKREVENFHDDNDSPEGGKYPEHSTEHNKEKLSNSTPDHESESESEAD